MYPLSLIADYPNVLDLRHKLEKRPVKAVRVTLVVTKANRPVYFNAFSVDRAYGGLQIVNDGTHILLFSVWDKVNQFDYEAKREDTPVEKRSYLLKRGRGVVSRDFNGEGTGVQTSIKPYNWKLDCPYTFELRTRPAKHKSIAGVSGIIYTLRVNDGCKKVTRFIASVFSPGSNSIAYFVSFLEQFKNMSSAQNQKVFYKNIEYSIDGQNWEPVRKGHVTRRESKVNSKKWSIRVEGDGVSLGIGDLYSKSTSDFDLKKSFYYPGFGNDEVKSKSNNWNILADKWARIFKLRILGKRKKILKQLYNDGKRNKNSMYIKSATPEKSVATDRTRENVRVSEPTNDMTNDKKNKLFPTRETNLESERINIIKARPQSTNGWKYIKGEDISPDYSHLTSLVYRLNSKGNIECASYNGSDCLWGVPKNKIDFNRIKPLVCQLQHSQEWGVTGNINKTHWCYILLKRESHQ